MRLIDADKLKQHYANCLASAEQIAAGTYKIFDYIVTKYYNGVKQ